MSLPTRASLYFPNIPIVLMRSHNPPHIAVFKVPRQLTKPDIKSLISQLYDIEITGVRTALYLGKTYKRAEQGRMVTKRLAGYKKAVVTMTSDFVFPEPIHEGAITLPAKNERPVGKNSHFDFKKRMKEVKSKDAGESK